MQLAERFRMLQSAPSSDAHKPRNSRISLSVGFFSTPLKSLSISRNKLGHEGVSVLCESLKTNTTLEKLDIAGGYQDELGASGAKIIAEMLKVNTPLTSLDMRQNDLDESSKKLVRSAAKEGMSLQL